MNIIVLKLLIKKGNFLRKIKEVSLAFVVVTPILFSGCMQEKISTIIPEKSTDKKIVLNLTPKEKSQQVLRRNRTNNREEKLPLAKVYPLQEDNKTLTPLSLDSTNTSNPLDEIINNIEETHVENIYSIKELTTQALPVDNNWIEETKEDEIIKTAEKFLGVKYVWAANGPSAFDCSGFTKYVFKENGINLPRHSSRQAMIGEKISFSELQKGDLVFFDTTKEFKHIVNHVGIYIGDNKFIHASSGGKKVIITSFDKKKFYKNKFLYARRVINQYGNIAMNTIK